ncbi:MAG: hypothetical protein RL030_164 [Pseudomonadota bacterium]
MTSRSIRIALLALISLWGGSLVAAPTIETVPVDLLPLIEEAAGNPEQFAVNVPHRLSAETSGAWSGSGVTRTWSHVVRIPDAVSLSFHAPRLQLPPSAVLIVRSASSTTTYRANDTVHGDFWSRVQVGDALEFSLEVVAAERSQVILEISSFQAGYRGLSPRVQSHAYFRRMRAQAAGDPDTQCVENYACNATPANQPAAQATVALLIGNLYLCSGTLINNTALDNTPYLLTARHCQNGRFGGGNPGAAANVTVYWNAQTSCGTALDTVIYTPEGARQGGARTVFEQQDAWLMQLDRSPVVDDAHFAGFDASGSPIVGGYSIHHALSYDKQITRWYGQAFERTEFGVLDSKFMSSLLNVVNDFGVMGPGASGAALFTPGNRIAGVLSTGRNSGSVSGYGSCPLPTLAAPDAVNREASFTSLAGVWDSIADTTSSTGTRTLASFLDPGSTGGKSAGSMRAARVSFTSSAGYSPLGGSVTLTWDSQGAVRCVANGGVTGDGWAGTRAASGNFIVSQASPVVATFGLRCELPGGGNVAASVSVNWAPPYAAPFLFGPTAVWATRPAELTWTSNVSPCTLMGGNLSLTNLPARGSVTTTNDTPADVKYTLTCGLPGFTNKWEQTVSFVTPNVEFLINGTHRQLGQPLRLSWQTAGDYCVPTGGAPGDGWTTTTQFERGGFERATGSVGTFDYGINCISGPLSVRKTVRVTVDTAPAYVTLVPVRSSVTFSLTPSDHVYFRFRTNLAYCRGDTAGFPERYLDAERGSIPWGNSSTEGEWIIAPALPGVLTLTLTCLAAEETTGAVVTASATVNVLPPPPPTATISASATQVELGGQFTITWSATNTPFCNGTGGAPTVVPWYGTMGPSGSQTLVMRADAGSGDYTFGVSCRSIDERQGTPATASVTVRVGVGSPAVPGPAAPAPGGESSGGGGLGLQEIGLLALLSLGISRRRHPFRRPARGSSRHRPLRGPAAGPRQGTPS